MILEGEMYWTIPRVCYHELNPAMLAIFLVERGPFLNLCHV